jgi:hypothetical protein
MKKSALDRRHRDGDGASWLQLPREERRLPPANFRPKSPGSKSAGLSCFQLAFLAQPALGLLRMSARAFVMPKRIAACSDTFKSCAVANASPSVW